MAQPGDSALNYLPNFHADIGIQQILAPYVPRQHRTAAI
jgi:hypothetical protein